MYRQGINANIMSLGGIAIAIGAMVDAAIVMIENAHKHIEQDGGKKPHWELITDAAKEVGPALFFSLLIITVSFLPVFTLEAQEGRLFKPLAFTKTYAMVGAALAGHHHRAGADGLPDPRARSRPKTKIRSTAFLIWIYHPVIELVLRHKTVVTHRRCVILAVTWYPWTNASARSSCRR